jgi:hypothetical protein
VERREQKTAVRAGCAAAADDWNNAEDDSPEGDRTDRRADEPSD